MNDELSALLSNLTPDELVFNGVLPSGDYAIPPASREAVFAWAFGAPPPDEIDTLRQGDDEDELREAFFDLSPLSSGGWGAIFPGGDQRVIDALKDALAPLLERRRAQAGVKYRDDLVFTPGVDTRESFFRRVGIAPAEPVNPNLLPYYLLIVGSPVDIPYNTFQYPLDAGYAVGRIYFSDGKGGHDLEAYAEYARRVVAAESAAPRPRRLTFFAPYSAGDRATISSAGKLIMPLREKLFAIDSIRDWDMPDPYYGRDANKDRLRTLLGGAEMPGILFTASHGMEFVSGDPLQMAGQGALVCADWAGPNSGAITPDMYFAGADVNADLDGLIAFHFACFSAGTPPLDDFSHTRKEIAPAAFVAALPTAMLKRGALAAIGHVERAWGTSFQWTGMADAQVGAFENTLQLMMEGKPVGHAMQQMNLRYLTLAAALQALRYDLDGEFSNPQYQADLENQFAFTWTANNDARGYVIVGDPAVRAAVSTAGAPSFAAQTPINLPSAPRQPQTLPEARASAPPTFRAAGNRIVIQIGDQQAVIEAQISGITDGGTVESFGLFGMDSVKEVRDKLTEAIESFAKQMGDTLKQVVEDATELTVETYVVPTGTPITPDIEKTLTPRASTVMGMDGDTKLIVPERAGELDTRLWNIHVEMVQQAQTYRVEMIRALISASAELIKALRG
ncbi:MAG: hypothetical protein SGI73_09400 [Chloroflexota bacterium]|nr:hypothetical protein [Chloroflexota bacterium]